MIVVALPLFIPRPVIVLDLVTLMVLGLSHATFVALSAIGSTAGASPEALLLFVPVSIGRYKGRLLKVPIKMKMYVHLLLSLRWVH